MKIHNQEINGYKSKLKRYRVAKGLTQSDLALLSGVNIKSIAIYEQHPDKFIKASVETASNLADCVGCTIEDLI